MTRSMRGRGLIVQLAGRLSIYQRVLTIETPVSPRKTGRMVYRGQTLKNPASGERITFRQTSAETNGELLAIDLELPANRRVPGGQHIHPKQEERFEVVEGTMRFRMGRKRVVAGPGEVVVVPPGQKHDFANEVQGAFPPRWLQRIVLAPLAWLARRRGHPRPAPRALEACA